MIKQLKSLINQNSDGNNNELMTVSEVAKHLKVIETWVYEVEFSSFDWGHRGNGVVVSELPKSIRSHNHGNWQ